MELITALTAVQLVAGTVSSVLSAVLIIAKLRSRRWRDNEE